MKAKIITIVLNTFTFSLISCQAFSEEPIKLQSSFVGDKEQPAVSYFVPWQGPDGNDKLYRKEEDKYEKSIDAVDRDVMLRSMRIYNEMDLEHVNK